MQFVVPKVVSGSQCEYRPGRSTEDLIFVMRQLFEKAREKNTPMYAVTKAFDSVNRGLLWEVLARQGVPSKFLNALQNLHRNMEGHAFYGGGLSERFPMCTGVRQGSVEGPVLFILFLAAVMEVVFPANSRYRSEMGVELEVQEGDITNARRFRNPVSHRVLDTIYADDTALVADSHTRMQETVQRFAEVAECFGLLINQSKTVVMRAVPNASVTPQHIYIGGNALQDVSSFSYLSSVITPNNDMQEEIDSKVAKARRAYHMLSQRLWRQHGIRRRTKLRCSMQW